MIYVAALDTNIAGAPYQAGDVVDTSSWTRTQLLLHLSNGTLFGNAGDLPALVGPTGLPGPPTGPGPTGGGGPTTIPPTYGEETFSWGGPLALGVGDMRVYNDSPAARTLLAARASLGVGPVGAAAIFDVRLDGNSIFPFTGGPIVDAVSLTSIRRPNVTLWPVGSYLTVDIIGIGSVSAGSDLTLTVGYQS